MNVTLNTGLYDPQFEHDACGVGFVAHIKGVKSHEIVEQGLQINENLKHRGACGCEKNTGDGAGILLQIPDKFLNCLFPATIEKHLTAGFGYTLNTRSSIDLSLSHGFEVEQTNAYGIRVSHSQTNAQVMYSYRF